MVKIKEIESWKYWANIVKHNRRFCFRYGKKELLNKIWYEKYKENLNFSNPQTFNEKLQIKKLENNQLHIICADKNKVRKYVEEKIGKKYLIPQYFCKRKIRKSDLEKLPNSFILKTSNGSGTNKIVFNKKKEDLNEVCKILNYMTKIKYGYIWGEFYYNKVPVRIVAEKLLKDEKGNIPFDYKIHCFKNSNNKKRKFIEIHYKVDGVNKKNIYDQNWKPLNYIYGFESDGRKFKKPNNLDEILYVADKLSEDTNYVRVDLYNINNKIYFGELTFMPGAGYAPFYPSSCDKLWGDYMS